MYDVCGGDGHKRICRPMGASPACCMGWAMCRAIVVDTMLQCLAHMIQYPPRLLVVNGPPDATLQ